MSCTLKGEIELPADKSIYHRAVILGSIAKGKVRIRGISRAEDNLRTIEAFQSMGIRIEEKENNELIIHGRGLEGLREPEDVIDCGNSGTTIRLLAGLLAGQNFFSILTGDNSLRQRPMKRVLEPLSLMGGKIWGRAGGNLAPLAIRGTKLESIEYKLPVASAQVKTSILLAGLYARGTTKIFDPYGTRDHTERMLSYLGVNLTKDKNWIAIPGFPELEAEEIVIPGDLSSASFFIVGAIITKNSEVLIKNVGINPTRTGILEILKQMGAHVEVLNKKENSGEPVGDILIKSSKLKSTELRGDLVVKTIDEIPILAIASALAEGTTVIRDAKELRVKETDRIKALVSELRKLGAEIHEMEDGFMIKGPTLLRGAKCSSWGDHRIAMTLMIANLVTEGKIELDDRQCIKTSFPSFFHILNSLIQ